jgi:hypothetical protein
MRTIKSYAEADSLNLLKNSKRVLFSMYSVSKENFKYWLIARKNKKISISKKQEIILNLLDNKTSIWLDGFGFALRNFNNKIISIEQQRFKNILNKIKNNNCIYFSKNLFSDNSLKIINKKFISNVVVVDFQIFQYNTLLEIINFLKNLYKIFKERKLIICIDLKKIDFNKLKFTNNEILEEILKNLNVENKLHTLSTYECILELN